MSFSDMGRDCWGAPPSQFDLDLRRQKAALQEKNTYLPGRPDYYLGLSIGRVGEPTAMVCLERYERPDRQANNTRQYHFIMRSCKRWPNGTPYMAIVEDTRKIFEAPYLHGHDLGIDKTGTGDSVMRMFRAAKCKARIMPIIVGGNGMTATVSDAGWLVPKVELAALVALPLEEKHLILPRFNQECEILANEVQPFIANNPQAGQTAQQTLWRDTPNGDLVLALAIACWMGGRVKQQIWMS